MPEHTIATVRIHPLFVILPFVALVLGGAVAAILVAFLPFLILPYFLFLFVAALVFALAYYSYLNTYWEITNHRIFFRRQNGLFIRAEDECRLEQVQEVISDRSGILATILDYGTLSLQTAATVSRFTIFHAASPEAARHAILQAQQLLTAEPHL